MKRSGCLGGITDPRRSPRRWGMPYRKQWTRLTVDLPAQDLSFPVCGCTICNIYGADQRHPRIRQARRMGLCE